MQAGHRTRSTVIIATSDQLIRRRSVVDCVLVIPGVLTMSSIVVWAIVDPPQWRYIFD